MRDTVSGSPVRALVADDHPVFRKGLSRFLAASGGIEVVGEAATGPQALELILRHEPDVALLDLQMPGLDGAQVAAAVRDEGLTTRVLIVSAYDDPAHVYDALAQGAAGFVHKEAPPDEIIADTKDGVLIDGRGSYSIDQQRFNGQFGGDAFWEIKNGKKVRMVSDVTYNAITTDFWQNLDAITGKEHWEMFGTTGDAKGQPVQINHPSHGSPWCRIRRIMVGAAYS